MAPVCPIWVGSDKDFTLGWLFAIGLPYKQAIARYMAAAHYREWQMPVLSLAHKGVSVINPDWRCA